MVASDVGGSGELVRDGETGRLVPAGDAAALAAAIVDCLVDREGARAMARRGQAVVRERHSLDAAMARTTAVYAEVLGAGVVPATSRRRRGTVGGESSPP